MGTAAKKRKFTVDEFHQLLEAGLLSEDDRIELIEGELIEMTPIGKRHAACVNRLNKILIEQCDEQYIVSVQNPLVLRNDTEPQPDLTILQHRDDYYEDQLPGPNDVQLLIEVAETSLIYDRDEKVPLYAQHGIPEVWVINLAKNVVDVFSDPEKGAYQTRDQVSPDENLQPRNTSSVRIPVDQIL